MGVSFPPRMFHLFGIIGSVANGGRTRNAAILERRFPVTDGQTRMSVVKLVVSIDRVTGLYI